MRSNCTKNNVHEIIFGKNNSNSIGPLSQTVPETGKILDNKKSAISNVAAIKAPSKEIPTCASCHVFTYNNDKKKIFFDSTEKTKSFKMEIKHRSSKKQSKKLLPIKHGSKTTHQYFLIDNKINSRKGNFNPRRGNTYAKDEGVNPRRGL